MRKLLSRVRENEEASLHKPVKLIRVKQADLLVRNPSLALLSSISSLEGTSQVAFRATS
jgi:hypothetical protein